jgi:hypothetical protein
MLFDLLHVGIPAHHSAVVGCKPSSGPAEYHIPNENTQNGSTTDLSSTSDISDSNDEVNCFVPPEFEGLAALQSKQLNVDSLLNTSRTAIVLNVRGDYLTN